MFTQCLQGSLDLNAEMKGRQGRAVPSYNSSVSTTQSSSSSCCQLSSSCNCLVCCVKDLIQFEQKKNPNRQRRVSISCWNSSYIQSLTWLRKREVLAEYKRQHRGRNEQRGAEVFKPAGTLKNLSQTEARSQDSRVRGDWSGWLGEAERGLVERGGFGSTEPGDRGHQGLTI